MEFFSHTLKKIIVVFASNEVYNNLFLFTFQILVDVNEQGLVC